MAEHEEPDLSMREGGAAPPGHDAGGALACSLAEGAPLPMAVTEGARHVVRCANAAFGRLVGVEPACLLGRPLADAWRTAGADEVRAALDRVVRTGTPYVADQQPADPTRGPWTLAAWPLPDSHGRPAGVVVQGGEATGDIRAVNERLLIAGLREQELAQAAQQKALHDALTGLPNRMLFYDRLQQELLKAQRTQTALALLYLDLDNFKAVNDTVGHQAGDLLLQQVAARLRGALRASDTVARLGGDEFAVLLPAATDVTGATRAAATILHALAEPFTLHGQPRSVGASIGIALSAADTDPDTLLSQADSAMYSAKRARGGYVVAGGEWTPPDPDRPRPAGGRPGGGSESPAATREDERGAPAFAELRAINEQLLIAGLREQDLADQLRVQLAFIGAVADAIDDGVVALDRAGRVTFVNPAAVRLLGGTAADLLGRALAEVVGEQPTDGGPAAASALLEPLRSGVTVRRDQASFARRDGTAFPAAASAAPIIAGGQVVGAVVAFRDIGALKRAEEGQRFLAEASQVLASSLDYRATLAQVARLAVPRLADWCFVDVVGEDGRAARLEVAHVDPTRAALAQEVKRFPPRPEINALHPPAQALATGASLLIPEFTDEMLRRAAQSDEHLAAMRGVKPRSFIVVPLVARGRVLGVLTFIATPESGRRYDEDDLRLAEDLAGRAALAVDNARLYAAAQAAVAARDDFLVSVSHDLQSPLGGIKGYAQLLQRRLRGGGAVDADQMKKSVGQIEAGVARATALIHELLDLARLRGGQALELERRPTDLVALARRAVAAADQAARQAITLEAGEPTLVGLWDEARLERVLDNLLDNAVKYSPPASAIDVRVAREDDMAVLAIRDQGLGIPAADLPHIFERFYRAANVVGRAGGTGLGLAGAHAIVEQHGGGITVESREGLGSTFTVRLPLGEPVGQ